MKISMTVKNCGDSDTWEEEIDTETTRCLSDAPEGMLPIDYAILVINYFNETIKPGEQVRDVVSAEEIK